MKTISDALSQFLLLESDTARLDVELLLCHVLDCDRVYLRSWSDKELTSSQIVMFDSLFQRRQNGEPVAHLVGERAFWTLNLKVSPETLIPRPDTEVLVEQAIGLCDLLPKDADVLDLGTGTGAIALAIASECPQWNVMGSDVFPNVVSLAKENARRNQLTSVEFICSSWFESVPDKRFHLIVSNPPYIDVADNHLSEGDVRFEPKSALVSEQQGLKDIKHIVREAKNYLHVGAWLVLEHGYDQAESVREVFTALGYQQVKTIQDYGQQDRITMARLVLKED